MAVTNNPNVPRQAPASANQSTGQAAAGEKFANANEVADYLQNGDEAMSVRYQLAGITEEMKPEEVEQRLKNSSWAKSFDEGVKAAVSKLGENPSKEDVKKAINNEFFKQHISKFTVDRASARIMDRVKDLYSDTFG